MIIYASIAYIFSRYLFNSKNRPKGMSFLDAVVSDIYGLCPSELIEAQKNGQKVFGIFCVYVPDEVIIAANGIVTRLCDGS